MAVVIRFICGTLGGQVPAVKTLMSEVSAVIWIVLRMSLVSARTTIEEVPAMATRLSQCVNFLRSPRLLPAKITDTSNQGVGMTLTALGWGAGLVIGPAIGGFLSQPADKYPLLDVWFFRRFPYSLPCLMVGVVTMGSVVCAACLLEETKVESRRTTAELDGSDIGSEEAGVKPPKDKVCIGRGITGTPAARFSQPPLQELIPAFPTRFTALAEWRGDAGPVGYSGGQACAHHIQPDVVWRDRV